MKNVMKKAAAVATTAAVAGQVNAADWTTTMGTVDFSGEVTAIQTAVGLIIGVTIVIFGGRKVLSMFRG
jgi:hypothetical protein